MLDIKESVRKKTLVKIMIGLIFGQNFDCVSGEISVAFPFLCLQRRRMGLNFSFEGFFTLVWPVAVLEQCPFIADFFALAAFQVHQKKLLPSGLSLCRGVSSVPFTSHWSKLTLIPLLIWRTFNHSRRWELIKEL